MDIIRVFYSQNSTLIDTIPEPFVAGSLSAALVGGNVQIGRPQSNYLFVSYPWQFVAGEDGIPFGSADECMTYLVAELVKERPVSFEFQAPLSDTWTITHGLGFRPNVQVHDSAGDMLVTDCQFPDINTAVLTFGQPTSGTAYLS